MPSLHRRKDPSLNQITKKQDSEIATLPNFQHQVADFLEEETLLVRFEISYNEVRSAMAQYLSKVLASPISEDDIASIGPDEDEDGSAILNVAVIDVQSPKEGI